MSEPRSDRQIAQSLPLPLEPRCELHNIPGCSPCRYLAESRADAARNPIPVAAPVRTVSVIAVPKSMQTVVLNSEEQKKLEDNVRSFFGVSEHTVQPEQSTHPISLRHFFQPVPQGKVREWSTDPKVNYAFEGMSPENIAFFLMQPEVAYSDYAKNKGNGPRRIFVTPDEAIKRQHHKLLNVRIRPLNSSEDNFTLTHVGTEIVQRASAIVIRIPESTEQKRIPVPQSLRLELEQARADHKLLKSRYIKSIDDDAQLTLKERAYARTRSSRRIRKLEQEIESYKKNKTVVISKSEISVPPCPEGSTEIFRRQELRQYIQEAFGQRSHAWDLLWAKFENKVLRRAQVLNLFRGWPNPLARLQWESDGKPEFGSPKFCDRYGWYLDGRDEPDLDPFESAQDKAKLGYRRGEGGAVPDESIRRCSPGIGTGWHKGAGSGPHSDERGDSADYRRDRRTKEAPGTFDTRPSAMQNVSWDNQ